MPNPPADGAGWTDRARAWLLGLGDGNRLLELGLDPARVDGETRRRVRVLTIGTAAICLLGIPSGARYALLGLTWLTWLHAAVIGLAAANLALLRRTGRTRLHGHVALVLLSSLLAVLAGISGGFADPNFGWFYVVPIAAAVAVGLRGAWIWAGLTLAVTFVFWTLPLLEVPLPHLIPEAARPFQQLFDRMTAILALALLASSFVIGERRAARELQQANEEISREAAYVQLLEHAAVSANEATSFEAALADGVRRICAAMDWPLGQVLRRRDDGLLVPSGFLHDEDPATFEPLHAVALGGRYRSGEGLPGEALETRRPVARRDIAEIHTGRAPTARALGLRSAVAIPVLVHGRVEAVLEFGCRAPLPHDERLLEVLAHVGRQLGRVAERKAMQELLQQAQKMEAVGQLAAGIAHEINNPMSFVRSNLHQLRDQTRALFDAAPGPTPRAVGLYEECEEILEDCLQGVDRTIDIVRDVRDFSRVGQREHSAVDCSAEIEGALRVAASQAPPGIRFASHLEEDLAVQGSATQLRQVMVNLLVNAIQAVGEVGEIRVTSKSDADQAVIRVQDDGPGIPPSSLERLFEPFFTTKGVGEGTGLGLYISYEIVRNHGGELRVESEPGAGATFEVRLPLSTPQLA